MDKKLFTDCIFIKFILDKKLKGIELDGYVSISHTFDRCDTRKEKNGDEIFFFKNDEEFLKITFAGHEEEEILIFMNCKDACFILRHKVGKDNFNKIKSFFSEVVTEIRRR